MTIKQNSYLFISFKKKQSRQVSSLAEVLI